MDGWMDVKCTSDNKFVIESCCPEPHFGIWESSTIDPGCGSLDQNLGTGQVSRSPTPRHQVHLRSNSYKQNQFNITIFTYQSFTLIIITACMLKPGLLHVWHLLRGSMLGKLLNSNSIAAIEAPSYYHSVTVRHLDTARRAEMVH